MPDTLRILLVGNGGREHALAWKLGQSQRVSEIHVVPGNGGTASLPKCKNVSGLSAQDFPQLVEYARQHALNFLVPGPEAPLVAGIVDFFKQHAPHIQTFGPTKAAARMEGSKTFAKEFMKRHNIPTARFEHFDRHDAAVRHLDAVDYPVVIKADGLAGGKGVIIPRTKEEAYAGLKAIMLDKDFGPAGNSVVIEEFLEGDEISILSLSDGTTIRSFPPAQDHKRIGDGDTGANTGGMGAYAPAPVASQEILDEIERSTLRPTIEGMSKDGMPFIGCLFSGFILTKTGPRVLEYNVRFGDPETQSCLPLLQTDLADLMLACTEGTLASTPLETTASLHACTVVAAAAGYPSAYLQDTPMKLARVDDRDGIYHFHAGTALKDDRLVTSGGRVMGVTATGSSLKAAVDKAYQGMSGIDFDGMQYRKDIAHRALSIK